MKVVDVFIIFHFISYFHLNTHFSLKTQLFKYSRNNAYLFQIKPT